jgi:hypothetical protein
MFGQRQHLSGAGSELERKQERTTRQRTIPEGGLMSKHSWKTRYTIRKLNARPAQPLSRLAVAPAKFDRLEMDQPRVVAGIPE